ncbi:fimbria/pilus outer membrane usher protein [Kluyvera intermedia]|uniref:fimbria/pilus outer membrane usher protein n=1 Tax=Kluyvera intermedia TaxID=61648 RepID=UPI003523A60F
MFLKFTILSTFLVFVFSIHKSAADEVEFNTDVLDVKDRKNISLSQFSHAGYLMPGEYTFTVSVNGQSLSGDRVIKYIKEGDNSSVCVPKDVTQELGIKGKYLSKLAWWHNNECLSLKSLDGMTVAGSLSTTTLSINIPQIYMEYVSDDWDPPSRWDEGVGGVIFDYNFDALIGRYGSSYGDSKYYNISGNGTTGVNVGAWRLRADWQGRLNYTASSNQKQSDRNIEVSQIYLFRPLPSIKSKLTLGETYYNSDVFDSFRFVGGYIESDDNMLPPNLRGYAPEVSGVAKTNAKVTISQQGRVLYQTQVAPGPFRIQDLSDAVTGKLDVKVEEQGGEIQTFTVNTSDIPYLTRPGSIRYKLAVGTPEGYKSISENTSDADESDDTFADMHHTYGAGMFAASEFSWGISSGWSMYGGVINSKDYNALSFGGGRDLLQFGAVALDASVARAQLPYDGEKNTGTSYRLSYSKNFDDYDSQISFAGYRFSTRDFMTMDEYLDACASGDTSDNDKKMYTITFNKQFREQKLSVYLNYSHNTYWDSPRKNNFNVSVSKTMDVFGFKNISTSLTAFKNQYNGMTDFGTYLSLSVPVGENSTLSLSSSYGNSASNEVSYYHTIDSNNSYELAAGGADGKATSRAYVSHMGDLAEVDANVNYQGGNSSSAGVTLRGGITATRHGLVLHRMGLMGGTRLMVDTDGVSGVPVRGLTGLEHTNMFGKAVIDDVNSYYRTSVNIDLDELDSDVDVIHSVVQGTLTEGAIGYRTFSVVSGQKAMAILRLDDGSSPPFGATVFNTDGLQTGIVNDDGSVYLSGIQPDEVMSVKWDGQVCDITLPASPVKAGAGLLLPCSHLRVAENL